MSKASLSPFEVKNTLINIAQSHSDKMMLNAGRGNPNFLATVPRHAFLKLGEFALLEAERSYSHLHSGFGGNPEQHGMMERFDQYLNQHHNEPGIELLSSSLSYVVDLIGASREDFLFEMVNAFLGCYYPFPPRMLSHCEAIVKLYIGQELCGTTTLSDSFDLFATEGGTAAMTYAFHSLSINKLLNAGDKIAIITPIFSPYLEIPTIPEFDLQTVYLKADEDLDWQLPASEIKKLEDPAIKLLCMVNPSNPPSVKMNDQFLQQVTELVKTKRQDLMIITDDVYATFTDNFTSIFATCPYNTLCVYSFSKFFGCTGWRLGTIALSKNNIFDDLIKQLPQEHHNSLQARYDSLIDQADHLKFIDRLVADSRTVALNHTAGISLPQQLQMTLFALANLLDEEHKYANTAKRLIRERYEILYNAIGYKPDIDPNRTDYYTLIDLELLAEQIYNQNFADWILDNVTGYQFSQRLAEETSVVLLPGKGFEVDHPSVRVSLANLTEHDYQSIGLAVKKVLEEYQADFCSRPS